MNLADYLSELLGMQDEVRVPGLGYFVRTRVNASFNNREGRFYPPYHQVKFISQPVDDESFAQYVADKKNISLASSKYFVEKFIAKLKEDARFGKALFADLGSFQMDADNLVFKPNERIPADPAFYGYPPVDIFREIKPAPAYTSQPVSEQAESTPAPVAPATPPPPRAVHSPEYYEEEVEEKRGVNVWLIIIIVLAVLGLAAFAVYKFYPSAYDKVRDMFGAKKPDTTTVTRHQAPPVKKDTTKKIAPVDTTAKPAATTTTAKPDSANMLRFEAIVEKTRNLNKANALIASLISQGYNNAHIAQNLPGKLIKVSVGSYSTYAAADSVINILVKKHVIPQHIDPVDNQLK